MDASLKEAEIRDKNKNETILMLRNRIDQLEKEQQTSKQKIEESDEWFKTVWKYLSTDARKDFRQSLVLCKDSLPHGTNRRLRDMIGVNISNKLVPVSNEEKKLEKAIKAFANENSSPMPDERLAKHGIRYYFAYKNVLYDQFLSSQELDCSYATFTRWWPQNVRKPHIDDYAKCCCVHCEVPMKLFHGLKKAGHIAKEDYLDIYVDAFHLDQNDTVDEFLEHLEELQTGEKKDETLVYNSWVKEKQIAVRSQQERESWKPKTVVTTVAKAAKDMEEKFHQLKDHLGRNKEIKQYIRELKQEVLEQNDCVVLNADWGENHVVKVQL